MPLSRSMLAAVVVGLSLGSTAFAQTPTQTPAVQPSAAPAAQRPAAPASARIRGVIKQVGPHEMVVVTRSGDEVTLKLAANPSVTWVQPIAIEAIKPGSFIGTAAVTQPDGTLKALEIQVFPESMRGVGEGHRPWDLGTGSTMTNGTVGDLRVSNGRTLTMTYKGGEQTVYVPQQAPVITYAPATPAALEKGAHVIVTATKDPDQTLTATRIGVGKDGLVPPM